MVRRLNDELRVLLTYHSNAIEGNTLSLRETQLVIEHGVTVGNHTLREYLEATNHAEALDYLIRLADDRTPITAETILELHRLTMATILADAGTFRRTAVSICGARLTPPPSAQRPNLIAAWVAWVEGEGKRYEPIVRAAIAHQGFEAVHPFEDGNGRTGRRLLNLMLMRGATCRRCCCATGGWATYRRLAACQERGNMSPNHRFEMSPVHRRSCPLTTVS